jgi:hypothetical protein
MQSLHNDCSLVCHVWLDVRTLCMVEARSENRGLGPLYIPAILACLPKYIESLMGSPQTV